MDKNMQGKIVKGISGFYYVHVAGSGIYECKAKGIFRNQKIKPLVGDNVTIAVLDEEQMLGNIEEILPRENALIRPAVANIDQALVIFAAAKPKPNFNLLDRFLIMMEYQKVPVTICFNKCDLLTGEELHAFSDVYEQCGYPVVYTSAREQRGIDALLERLDGKVTSVAGPSGVGKSSIINCLQPERQMETGAISRKIERGRPATRRLFQSKSRLTLWIHRDFPRWIFRGWKRKICGGIIRNLKSMSQTAVLRAAVISESRTAG